MLNVRAKLSAAHGPKMAMASVPPPSTMNVDTSWLLTMSPCACASSRRLCVGSSVACESSRSPAMGLREVPHLRAVIGKERGHHRTHQQHDDEKPCQQVDRHGDEEHLQLRHHARE